MVHDFRETGEVPNTALHLAGLGWSRYLPGYAKFDGELSMLKSGLYAADLAASRSRSYIRSVIKAGSHGTRHIRERLSSRQLVGLRKNDDAWGPGRALTEELAMEWAQHTISLYRALTPFAFSGMERSRQTFPEVSPQVQTHEEQLEGVSKKARQLFDAQRNGDRKLIEQAIDRGEVARFAAIRNKDDLKRIMRFLKVEITSNFEKDMTEAGLGEFLKLFYPGELDRLLSITVSLRRYEGLYSSGFGLKRDEKISIFDAMRISGEHEQTDLLHHTLGIFHTLKLIAGAAKMSDTELSQALKPRGKTTDEESLANETAEFRHLAAVHGYISQEAYRGFFRAFLVAALLHDWGKLVKHSEHSGQGAKLIEDKKEIKGLLSDQEIEFAKKLVRYHSHLADTVVLWERNPERLLEIFEIFDDKRLRDLAIRCLYILSVADQDAVGKKGRLSPLSIRKVRRVYSALLYSANREELNNDLETLGLGSKLGQSRWNAWVVREWDKRAVREREAKAAAKELKTYVLEQEAATKVSGHSKRRAKRSLLKHADKLAAKVAAIQDQLRQIKDINKITGVTRNLDDPKLRARFLIWLSEFTRSRDVKSVSFEFNVKNPKVFQQEIKKLASLLEESNLNKLNHFLTAEEVRPGHFEIFPTLRRSTIPPPPPAPNLPTH
jgi:hypothetical protein